MTSIGVKTAIQNGDAKRWGTCFQKSHRAPTNSLSVDKTV